MRLEEFDILKQVYGDNGFSLYIIGGTSRDLLLNLPISDIDFVTDATVEEERNFLPNANYSFAKYGSISLKINSTHVDITTLRKEEGYIDHRHPSKITFVKTPIEDYPRRDFTINALYIDMGYHVLDYYNGLKDLKNKTIRFIGDPILRIEEDPLRICRAERFAKRLNFKIEEKTLAAINEKRYLLKEINPVKLLEEEKKGWLRK